MERTNGVLVSFPIGPQLKMIKQRNVSFMLLFEIVYFLFFIVIFYFFRHILLLLFFFCLFPLTSNDE